jgi:hypothetical protein
MMMMMMMGTTDRWYIIDNDQDHCLLLFDLCHLVIVSSEPSLSHRITISPIDRWITYYTAASGSTSSSSIFVDAFYQ